MQHLMLLGQYCKIIFFKPFAFEFCMQRRKGHNDFASNDHAEKLLCLERAFLENHYPRKWPILEWALDEAVR
jgi:hypothetical protein